MQYGTFPSSLCRHLEGSLRAVQQVMGPGVPALRHQVCEAGNEAVYEVKRANCLLLSTPSKIIFGSSSRPMSPWEMAAECAYHQLLSADPEGPSPTSAPDSDPQCLVGMRVTS